jgi:hypothetical protein
LGERGDGKTGEWVDRNMGDRELKNGRKKDGTCMDRNTGERGDGKKGEWMDRSKKERGDWNTGEWTQLERREREGTGRQGNGWIEYGRKRGLKDVRKRRRKDKRIDG